MLAFQILAILFGVTLLWLLPNTPVPGLILIAAGALSLYLRVRSRDHPRMARHNRPPSRDHVFEMVEREQASIDHDQERRRRGELDADSGEDDRSKISD